MTKDKQLKEFKDSIQILDLIQLAKAEDDPFISELYQWSLLKDLRQGRIAERAKAMLANYLIPKALENLLTAPEKTIPEIIEDKSQKVQIILQEYKEFMNEITKHPDASVVGHYLNLGWSRGKGNRVKAELLAQELIESEVVKIGQGRPKEILKPTAKAKELFGL